MYYYVLLCIKMDLCAFCWNPVYPTPFGNRQRLPTWATGESAEALTVEDGTELFWMRLNLNMAPSKTFAELFTKPVFCLGTSKAPLPFLRTRSWSRRCASRRRRRTPCPAERLQTNPLCWSCTDSLDRKSTRLNSSHSQQSRMPSSA